MNNLVFWAHSYCRSTLKFYSELAKALSRNCFIYTWIENLDLRSATGFSNSEFSDLKIVHIGNDIDLAEKHWPIILMITIYFAHIKHALSISI